MESTREKPQVRCSRGDSSILYQGVHAGSGLSLSDDEAVDDPEAPFVPLLEQDGPGAVLPPLVIIYLPLYHE